MEPDANISALARSLDPSLRERLIGMKVQRDELSKEAAELQRHLASGEAQITPEKIERLARLLRDKLHHGSLELRQAHTRLVMDQVTVRDEEIRISGSKALLAWCASAAPGLCLRRANVAFEHSHTCHMLNRGPRKSLPSFLGLGLAEFTFRWMVFEGQAQSEKALAFARKASMCVAVRKCIGTRIALAPTVNPIWGSCQ